LVLLVDFGHLKINPFISFSSIKLNIDEIFEGRLPPDPVVPINGEVCKNPVSPISFAPTHEDGRIGETLGRNPKIELDSLSIV
jgi:hypothetical protein